MFKDIYMNIKMSVPNLNAGKKMLDRINLANKDDHLRAIRKFFELAENKNYDDLDMETRTKIEKSDNSIKKFCTEVCGEAINRDMCYFLVNKNSSSNRVQIGSEVYKALKK